MNPDFAGSQYVIEVTYLIASALFIFSLKWMSSPSTARHGIWAGEVGMVLAIAGTLLRHGIVDWKWIIIALVLGSGKPYFASARPPLRLVETNTVGEDAVKLTLIP